MLHSIHSNRMEHLVEALLQRLAMPLGDPLSPETILVQNPGMARWLGQQIALRTGIAANLEFPLPASFAWRIQQAWLGEDLQLGAYDKESLRWQIMGTLPDRLDRDEFGPLRRYLTDDTDRIRLYQLSGRIADLFDQYLVYRPQMMLRWERGDVGEVNGHESWQAALWQAIVERTNGDHRARIYSHFLQQADRSPKDALPQRVSIFGLSALAPVYLQVFEVLSRRAEVCLYLLNPCREYWADLQDDKGQARKRALYRRSGRDDVSGLMDVGNPLLASMGQVGQVLADQLLELDADSEEQFRQPAGEGLLPRLQGDILNLKDRRNGNSGERILLPAEDRSVQIHACHSPMREVQVLHDRLRRCFDELGGLNPRDVVVMAPDIGVYAPWIEAVFGTAGGERHIPWSIADLGTAVSSLLQAVEQLLHLPDFRFEASAVLSLLEVPALARRFGIDGTGLETVRRWVRESAIRWGSDADMQRGLGLPPVDANSWDAGLERLFRGYALAPDTGLQGGVLPYGDIEGAEAELLGGLAELLQCLMDWRAELARPAKADAWPERINRLLVAFFQPDSEGEFLLQGVRGCLADIDQRCRRTGFDDPLPLPLIRAELAQALSAAPGAQRFMVGAVTFCNMVPMRSIPFRVICLLGMNDGDFPRRDDAIAFDLMAAAPVPSDRSRRLDDRYLFLEALLSARDRFYISYRGNSQRDNSRKVPSVVVSELLDYLAQSHRLEGDGDFAEGFVLRHPLQPFSRRYFDGSDPRLFSYDSEWLEVAASGKTEPTPFVDGALPMPEADTEEVDIGELAGFLINPAGWFLDRCLGVRFSSLDEQPEDQEPFDVPPFVGYRLRAELLESALAGNEPDSAKAIALAGGELPQGNAGELAFKQEAADIAGLAERVGRRSPASGEALEIDLNLAGIRLTGWLEGVCEDGLLRYRAADLKAKDWLRLWVGHLLLSLLWLEQGRQAVSIHVALDKTLVLNPVADPGTLLADLLLAWKLGRQSPLAFFGAAALAYVGALEKGEEQALAAAARAWNRDYDAGANNMAVATVFSDSGILADPAFAEWARRIAGPLHAVSTVTGASRDRAA